MATAATTVQKKEVLPPPTERYTLVGWLKKNLFDGWLNSILTFVTAALIYVVFRPLLTWAFTSAEWEVIPRNLSLFMKGQYPADQLWRIWLCLYILGAVVGLSWGVWVRRFQPVSVVVFLIPVVLIVLPFSTETRIHLAIIEVAALAGLALGRFQPQVVRRALITLWLLYFPVVILIIRGVTGDGGFLPSVPTNLWGGLLLSLLLAVVGIVFSFPIGVLMALGRQSKLPAIRTLSVLYIELIRGVPLITILFMAQVMVPLFLPADIKVDRVLRAMVGITLFAAAYLAENVRGGLQSIPKGQYEAAYALGLNGFQTTVFIILPQALRAVIPVLVGQFIGLFKDTSLVSIVGLLDLLGIAQTVLSNPNFIGKQQEVYAFVAAVYWIFSYAMSYASRRLEVALGVGER